MLSNNKKYGRFIDPLTDFGFKLLFGTEPNKDLLIAFLNEIFKGRKVITELKYNKTENQGPQSRFRKSIFDLTCTGKDNEQFIIEIQRIYQQFFKDRSIYYTSDLIYSQEPKGNPKWDFKLKEVFFIAIMDFEMFESPSPSYIHRVHLTDEATGKVFYNKLGYTFIELPKFNKTQKQVKTDLDRWLFVLKNMANCNKIPLFLTKRIFEKVFNIAEISNLSKEAFMVYEKDLKAKWDEYAVLSSAIARGIEQGIEKGIEQGIEQTELKKNTEFVTNLLETKQFSISQIANFANVSEAFVRKVKKTLK